MANYEAKNALEAFVGKHTQQYLPIGGQPEKLLLQASDGDVMLLEKTYLSLDEAKERFPGLSW